MASFQYLTPFTGTTLLNSTQNRNFKPYPKQTQRFKVSCNLTPDENEKPLEVPETQKLILPETSVYRRNLLLGLGGLYSTVNFTSRQAAFADPITTPRISTCVNGPDELPHLRTKACCPPVLSKEQPFVFPSEDEAIRIRPAAQNATEEYVAKYKAALQAMKALPDDHPHSFEQQAKIHCAYCTSGYTQNGSPAGKPLRIHNSWLFFPFHRWYLYFHERILGKLIGDPTFALPYWNWDYSDGMELPSLFQDGGNINPAFDDNRNIKHVPPAIVDLDYNKDIGFFSRNQIHINLILMHRQMITNGVDALNFFGGPFKAGDDPATSMDLFAGSVEGGCHNSGHRWVGDPRQPQHEDMGIFYSAAYDPLFYAHHANVDRMWKLWKDLAIGGHSEPTDPDWHNASFLFYDENLKLVRVYNKDCVDLDKLKYNYQFSPMDWRNMRPTSRFKKSNIGGRTARVLVREKEFPLKLDIIKKVRVKRTVKNRSQEDKEKENEVLVIKGIKFNDEKFVKFDVIVNDQDNVTAISAEDSEFAGSFYQLPHNHIGEGMLMTSGARFGLNDLLEDIEAEADEFIDVTLVPRAGCEEVTIREIVIELVPIV